MKTRFLVISILILSGCGESWVDRANRENEEHRSQSLAKLDNATSLEDFLLVQRDDWMSGNKSLDVNFISAKRRQWYINNHPELSPELKEIILNGKWKIGMKADDLLASIGIPDHTNRDVFSNVVHEQWKYGYDIRVPRERITYFYFENGILTSWQD